MRTCLHEVQKGAGRSLYPRHFQTLQAGVNQPPFVVAPGPGMAFSKGGERSFIFLPKEELFPFWPRSLLEQHGLGVASLLWALWSQSSCLLLCVEWVCLFCSA